MAEHRATVCDVVDALSVLARGRASGGGVWVPRSFVRAYLALYETDLTGQKIDMARRVALQYRVDALDVEARQMGVIVHYGLCAGVLEDMIGEVFVDIETQPEVMS